MGTLYWGTEEHNHVINNYDDKLIELYLEPANPGKSNWFRSLTLFPGSRAKNVIEFFNQKYKQFANGEMDYDEYKDQIDSESYLTVRQCPGIKDLMNNSYMVKAPCDIVIGVDRGGLKFSQPADTFLLKIQHHHPIQFHSQIEKHNIFKDQMNVKFTFPIRVKTKNKVSWMFTNPVYHNADSKLDVVLGQVAGDYTQTTSLILNTTIKVSENQDIHIRKGDVLAYMVFPEKMNLVRKQNNFFLRGLRSKFTMTRKNDL